MVKKPLEKTQEEICQEIARALGGSGSKRESCLDELKGLESALRQVEDVEECNRMVDAFNGLRVKFPAACSGKQGHRLALGSYP